MEERRKTVEEITDCPYRNDCGILEAYRKDRYMSGVVESCVLSASVHEFPG